MRYTIILAALAMLLSSCQLEDADTTGHKKENIEYYARETFHNLIVQPASALNILLSLDDYIKATEEEKQQEAFAWHRENIFHEDDVTFFIKPLGTVKTYGKSFLDQDCQWQAEGIEWSRHSENTWKIGSRQVTIAGRDEQGRKSFWIEANEEEETDEDIGVKAHITTPEGPVTLIEPRLYIRGWDSVEVPEGKGLMRIEVERDGKIIDTIDLKYTEDGKTAFITWR